MVDKQTIQTVGMGLFALVIVLAILSPFVQALESTQTTGDTYQVTFDLEGDGQDGVLGDVDTEFGEHLDTVENAEQSLGDAIRLTGANDSQFETESDVDLASGANWSVCTWGEVDSAAANDTMTAISADGRALIQYNGSDGNWSGWYFDDGSTDSYIVNVSAPNQPGNLTNVCLIHNSTDLAIYRNNTPGEVKSTTGSNIADAHLNATNWHGVLEETRVVDVALSSSQRQGLVDHPNRPLSGATPTARLMYDTRASNPSTLPVYWSDTRIRLSNASIVDGFPGENIVQGTDYKVQFGTFKTISSSDKLDGAPTAWATVTTVGAGAIIDRVVNVGGSALGLIAIGLLAIAGMKLADYFGGGF